MSILARFKIAWMAAFGQAFASVDASTWSILHTVVAMDLCSGTTQWHDHLLECQKPASTQTSSSQSQA
eukprot:8707753-Pyramimonas_sp.AAC.1